MAQATAVKKVIHIGKSASGGDVEIEVWIENGQLSMTGSVWLKSRRDIESGGQNYEHIKADTATLAIPQAKLDRMLEIWRRWHLNDMRAGCEHQRANWDVVKQIEVVHYGLTYEAQRLRDSTRAALADAALRGEVLELTPQAKALAGLDKWFADVFTPPDADSPLSGCYEVKKREVKAAGWVYPAEHADGLLGKPCDVCGYKYGTRWLMEELPAEVIAEVESW